MLYSRTFIQKIRAHHHISNIFRTTMSKSNKRWKTVDRNRQQGATNAASFTRPPNHNKATAVKTIHSNHPSWPSDLHKCLFLKHNDINLSIDHLKTLVQPYGTVSNVQRRFFVNHVRSVFEMSTASEAETAWKSLSKNKPNGVTSVYPEKDNATIGRHEEYWDEDQIKKGLSDGTLVSGTLRINPKMFQNAYISDGKNPDILLDSVISRNRALAGDVVAVKLRPPEEWLAEKKVEKAVADLTSLMEDVTVSQSNESAGKKTIKTGDVVGIVEKRHSRVCVGHVHPCTYNMCIFKPVDHGVPRLLIPKEQCPDDLLSRPKDFENKLFMATIENWLENSSMAVGKLSQCIGDRGEIEPETTRILLEHAVDSSEFPPTINDSLPNELPWTVPAEEYSSRRDLRSECVFTIDPSTAKDLDDALHCKKLGNDLFEVGVHIADVSYFVKPKTQVDDIAAKRCTSVYLVQRVIPMLPTLLCEELCSLNPGKDRLTYSVIWKMTGEGKIVDIWFGRTVIHSCVKLSYDHAQSFIDSPDKKDFDVDQFPEVHQGHALNTIGEKILDLHKISQCLRNQRYEDGALRLDQIKLAYTLDKDTGMPNSCFTYEYKASNELIEEFMLLANISVAEKLNAALPTHAFLRCHPEPKDSMLKGIASYCSENGWKLDVSSSKALATSLSKAAESKELAEHCLLGLQMLAIKPQELALYFCAGCVDDEEKYRHYALNVALYTHFTSPIRRYADVIVHRQLSAVLGDRTDVEKAELSPQDLQKQANDCNTRKSEAKKVQDASVELFFYALVKNVGSLEGEAVVMYVYDHSFDVLSVKFGQIYRVYLDSLPIVGSKQTNNDTELEILWPCDGTERYKLTRKEQELAKKGNLKMPQYTETITQTIKVFSTVNVCFEAEESNYRVRAYLKRQADT